MARSAAWSPGDEASPFDLKEIVMLQIIVTEGKASTAGCHQLNFPPLTSGKSVNHSVLCLQPFSSWDVLEPLSTTSQLRVQLTSWQFTVMEVFILWKLANSTTQSFLFVSGGPVVKHLPVHRACYSRLLHERGDSELRGKGPRGWGRDGEVQHVQREGVDCPEGSAFLTKTYSTPNRSLRFNI